MVWVHNDGALISLTAHILGVYIFIWHGFMYINTVLLDKSLNSVKFFFLVKSRLIKQIRLFKGN